MTVQYIIIGVAIAASVGYAAWRAWKALRVKSGDPCYGCALKEACQKRRAGVPTARRERKNQECFKPSR